MTTIDKSSVTKLSNEALADELGFAKQAVKNAEAVFDALKGEAKRRGLNRFDGQTFGFTISQEMVLVLDTVKVKEFLGEAVGRFQKEQFRETLRVVASANFVKEAA
jgi:RNAse (barnase) inhibitor barstar